MRIIDTLINYGYYYYIKHLPFRRVEGSEGPRSQKGFLVLACYEDKRPKPNAELRSMLTFSCVIHEFYAYGASKHTFLSGPCARLSFN